MHLLKGQLSSPVNCLGGQMSTHAIFHRGADVRGGGGGGGGGGNVRLPSLGCVNRTRPNIEIMITMRDIWTSNLGG